MKLELKHLAPYLPYALKVKLEFMEDSNIPWYYEDKEIFELEGMMLDWWSSDGRRDITKITPVLRPMSDLFNDRLNPIPINETKNLFGWDYLFYDVYKKKEPFNVNALRWATLNKFLEWNLDVFGLIDAGLAIDKTTVL